MTDGMQLDWIKLLTDIFEDRKMLKLRQMPEGRSLQLIWLHMLVEAGKTNDQGWIYLTEDAPYTIHDFSKMFDEPANMIEIGLKMFERFGMIEIDVLGRICITNWFKHQNVESHESIKERDKERKQVYRKAKALEKQLLDAGQSKKAVALLLRGKDGKFDRAKIEAIDSHVSLVPGQSQDVSQDVPRIERELELELEKDIKIKNIDHRPAKKPQIDDQCASSFDLFWDKYPNKKGKSKAWGKWQTYYRNGEIDIDAILASIDDYISFVEFQRNQRNFDMQFMHGVTYVNGKNWESDWTIPTTSGLKKETASDDDDPIAQLLKRVNPLP